MKIRQLMIAATMAAVGATAALSVPAGGSGR